MCVPTVGQVWGIQETLLQARQDAAQARSLGRQASVRLRSALDSERLERSFGETAALGVVSAAEGRAALGLARTRAEGYQGLRPLSGTTVVSYPETYAEAIRAEGRAEGRRLLERDALEGLAARERALWRFDSDLNTAWSRALSSQRRGRQAVRGVLSLFGS